MTERSRFPCRRRMCMPGSQTTRGGTDPRAIASAPVAFCCHDGIGTPDYIAFAAHNLAYTPLSMLHVRSRGATCLNPPPHPITVYASHPPSPTTAQHSLPGGALPPYRVWSFTGRNASASPDAAELKFRIHFRPAVSPQTIGS